MKQTKKIADSHEPATSIIIFEGLRIQYITNENYFPSFDVANIRHLFQIHKCFKFFKLTRRK